MLELGLKDIVETVVEDAKDVLLPALGVWASKIDKFQTHMIPQFLRLCKEALEVSVLQLLVLVIISTKV